MRIQEHILHEIAKNIDIQSIKNLRNFLSSNIKYIDFIKRNSGIREELYNKFDFNFKKCIKAGNLYGLEKLLQGGTQLAYSIDYAAVYGHLHIIKWLHNKNQDYVVITEKAMDWAARKGHLEIVQWLHINYEKYDSRYWNDVHNPTSEDNVLATEDAMDYAAKYGELEVVKWLHENRTEGCTKWAMNWAAMNGHLRVLKWLYKNRSEGCIRDSLDWGLMCAYPEVYNWLYIKYKNGCECGNCRKLNKIERT